MQSYLEYRLILLIVNCSIGKVILTCTLFLANADYYDEWSIIGAETIMNLAEEFLEKTKQILNLQSNNK